MAGVETSKKRVDFSGPYQTEAEGRGAAEEILRILNSQPGRSAIEFGPASSAAAPPDWAKALVVLAWTIAMLAVVTTGAAWQISLM